LQRIPLSGEHSVLAFKRTDPLHKREYPFIHYGGELRPWRRGNACGKVCGNVPGNLAILAILGCGIAIDLANHRSQSHHIIQPHEFPGMTINCRDLATDNPMTQGATRHPTRLAGNLDGNVIGNVLGHVAILP